ncbi:tRNA (adenosine(37)-N6)-threonylcarbamoyltransferase complex dimerization subunit type 1 TsaB [Bacteroidota bacterium]
MTLLLNIETATPICSVAISQDGELLAIRESKEKNSHSAKLNTFIEEMMEEAKVSYKDLDAVAVSMGPGSYTGLRIGVSAAKGFCYAMDIPLIGIPTLMSMANGAKNLIKEDMLLCPMIDARRMEVYCALFDSDLKEIQKTDAIIIEENTFHKYLNDSKIAFFGDGAEKCKELLSSNSNAIFLNDYQISSEYMISLAMERFNKKEFDDTAYFEPFYLKDFIAGKPKVKGLR